MQVFELADQKVHAWLRANFGEHAEGKRMPGWIFSAEEAQRHALLDGYVDADGHEREDGRVTTVSVSRALAVGVKMLAGSLGYVANITRRRARVTLPIADNSRALLMQSRAAYSVDWDAKPDWSKSWQGDLHRWGRVRSVDPCRTQVTVYDITVADDESFIADGQVVHNCHWGPGRDGSTFQWWIRELELLGYEHEQCFFNSGFFPPCPQSRDRIYIVAWRKGNQKPDLDYRPTACCTSERCGGKIVQAVQAWKPRKASWPLERWGKHGSQYVYACPDCSREVLPVQWPAYSAINWANLGPRLDERASLGMPDLADSTEDRIRRALGKFRNGPPVVVPCKAIWGSDRSVLEPFVTQTTQQDKALLVQGSIIKNNGDAAEAKYRGHPLGSPLGAVTASPTQSLALFNGVSFPVHGNDWERPGQTRARSLVDPMFTLAASQNFGFAHMSALVEMRGGGSITSGQHAVTDPAHTVTAGGFHHGLVSPALFTKQNGGPGDTAWHDVADPFGTITGRDTTGLLVLPWVEQFRSDPIAISEQLATVMTHARHALASIEAVPFDQITDDELGSVRFRMLEPDPELRRTMAFGDDYILLGNKTQMTSGLGNAVTPPVANWITERCMATLRGQR